MKQIEWYSFIIIPIIAVIMLVYIPMITTVKYSLYDVSFLGFGEKFIGLKNYKMLLNSTSFKKALGNTIILTLLGLLNIPLGFILACFINSIKHKTEQGFFRVGFYIPNIITGVSVVLMFQVILSGNNGLFNRFLSAITSKNITIGWLSDSKYAKIGASLLYIWMNLGYSMLINLASMQAIPNELYEAAEIDGAGWFQKWVKITIPQLRQCFSFLFVTGAIAGMARFTDLFILSGNNSAGAPGGSLQTILLYIYQYSFEVPEYGISSAGAMILFVISFVLTLVNVKFSGMFKKD